MDSLSIDFPSTFFSYKIEVEAAIPSNEVRLVLLDSSYFSLISSTMILFDVLFFCSSTKASTSFWVSRCSICLLIFKRSYYMFLNMLTSATINFLRQSPCITTWSLIKVSAWSSWVVISLNNTNSTYYMLQQTYYTI